MEQLKVIQIRKRKQTKGPVRQPDTYDKVVENHKSDNRGVRMKIYRGIGPEEDTIVAEDKAYDYALERCLKGTEEDRQEFRKELVEWFFSGNWIEEEENDI